MTEKTGKSAVVNSNNLNVQQDLLYYSSHSEDEADVASKQSTLLTIPELKTVANQQSKTSPRKHFRNSCQLSDISSLDYSSVQFVDSEAEDEDGSSTSTGRSMSIQSDEADRKNLEKKLEVSYQIILEKNSTDRSQSLLTGSPKVLSETPLSKRFYSDIARPFHESEFSSSVLNMQKLHIVEQLEQEEKMEEERSQEKNNQQVQSLHVTSTPRRRRRNVQVITSDKMYPRQLVHRVLNQEKIISRSSFISHASDGDESSTMSSDVDSFSPSPVANPSQEEQVFEIKIEAPSLSVETSTEEKSIIDENVSLTSITNLLLDHGKRIQEYVSFGNAGFGYGLKAEEVETTSRKSKQFNRRSNRLSNNLEASSIPLPSNEQQQQQPVPDTTSTAIAVEQKTPRPTLKVTHPPYSYYRKSKDHRSLTPLYEETSEEFQNLKMLMEEDAIGVNIIYDESDSASVSEGKSSPRRIIIKSATLDKLVEKLTSHQNYDNEYLQIFLLTYRSFSTAEQVFDKMLLRFNIIPTEPNPLLLQDYDTLDEEKQQECKESFNNFFSQVLIPIRLRICQVLNTWIEHYFFDFRDDLAMIEKLDKFIQVDLREVFLEKASLKLKKALEKHRQRRNTFSAQQIQELTQISELVSKTASSASLLDKKKSMRKSRGLVKGISEKLSPEMYATLPIHYFKSKEIASQLTLICFDMFSRIRPKEFFNNSWNKPNKEESSPNIVAMIRRTNTVGDFVATDILSEVDVKKRAKVIQKYIKIAFELYQLRNYNTFLEVVSGLLSSPVHRLRKSWALVDSTLQHNMQQFEELISPSKNFSKMRSLLKHASVPAIPYIGTFLTDITFVEDGNKDNLENGLINWTKRRFLGEIIRDLQTFQHSPYLNLEEIPELKKRLLFPQAKSPTELYKLSCELEPKETLSV